MRPLSRAHPQKKTKTTGDGKSIALPLVSRQIEQEISVGYQRSLSLSLFVDLS